MFALRDEEEEGEEIHSPPRGIQTFRGVYKGLYLCFHWEREGLFLLNLQSPKWYLLERERKGDSWEYVSPFDSFSLLNWNRTDAFPGKKRLTGHVQSVCNLVWIGWESKSPLLPLFPLHGSLSFNLRPLKGISQIPKTEKEKRLTAKGERERRDWEGKQQSNSCSLLPSLFSSPFLSVTLFFSLSPSLPIPLAAPPPNRWGIGNPYHLHLTASKEGMNGEKKTIHSHLFSCARWENE